MCSFSFNLKPSTLSTFSMPNGRLFQLEIVVGKKEYLYELQFAWRCLNLKSSMIFPCTRVGWLEDALRFNRRESVNNFVEKD